MVLLAAKSPLAGSSAPNRSSRVSRKTHVVEHLAPEALNRLVRLSWRALQPGGVLIIETPSPLSIVVAARNFWLDPTHVRPVHPETLELFCEQSGFDPVVRLLLRPFDDRVRLPEIAVDALTGELAEVAHQVNLLRDGLDDLLYGHQDYGVVATRPD
jgi:O-antigen chain-terminating methyltransferase